MASLSDVVAPKDRKNLTRVAALSGVARFTYLCTSIAMLVLALVAFAFNDVTTAIAAEAHNVANALSIFSIFDRDSHAINQSTPADAEGPYCPPHGDAIQLDARSISQDTHDNTLFALPNGQPGREAGSQSHGSLRDSRATEEAPSADEPNLILGSGGTAECKG
jgi:hypothetical protein